MQQLSVGLPSNLRSYKTLCEGMFGADSEATAYINRKIEESPHGAEEEVIADERQVIQLLLALHTGRTKID